MQTQPIRKRDHAYSNFTEKLLSRDISPGQFVSQRELVTITGMPLGAIREMIPRLEADGLIRTSPQRGLQVLSIDMDLVRNAFQLRRIIESEAIAQFCRTASNADIENIKRRHETILAEALASEFHGPRLDSAQRMDWDFHDLIVDRMENQLVSDIYRVNAIKIRLIRNASTRMLPELVASVMEEHLAIIEALEHRDETASVSAIQAHIESARRRTIDL